MTIHLSRVGKGIYRKQSQGLLESNAKKRRRKANAQQHQLHVKNTSPIFIGAWTFFLVQIMTHWLNDTQQDQLNRWTRIFKMKISQDRMHDTLSEL